MKNDWIFLIKETMEKSKRYFWVVVIKNLIGAISPILNIMGIGAVVNAITNHVPYVQIRRIIFLYVGISAVFSILTSILGGVENALMRKATNVLQFGYMRDCVSVDYHYVQNRKLLELKPKSMGARPEFFLNLWGRCINELAKIVGVFTVFVIISPWFIFIMILLAFFVIQSNVWVDKKEMEYRQEKTENDRKLDYLYLVMTDYKYAKEIRINKAAKLIEEKYNLVLKHQMSKLRKMIQKKIGAHSIGKLIQAIQLLCVYAFFTYQVITKSITLAEYTVMVSAVTVFVDSTIAFFSNVGYVKNNCQAIKYLKEYNRVVNENRVNTDSNAFDSKKLDYATATITFDEVSFSYPGTEKKILDRVSFTIQGNEKTALIGLNGAGKSTLIMLILRLYHPISGKIYLDGMDIESVPYQEYISKFGVVLQDFFLFAYSIRENLLFDESVDRQRLELALRQSGMKDKISRLVKGIDTSIYKELDSDGIEFSGGDAQKLALARVLYKNSKIVILDEPTSSFDPIAEYEFFHKLQELSNGRTTIFVSHRLSSTVFCDKILVLKDGKIVEEGNHEELMKQEGIYKELFMLQAQYYERGEAC